MREAQTNSRRDFLELLAGGSVAFAAARLGLSERSWAQSTVPEDTHLADGDEWEFYKPGVYDEDDRKILQAFQAKLDKLHSRGKLSFADIVSQKPDVTWGLNIRPGFEITHEYMLQQADRFGGGTPWFSDKISDEGSDGYPQGIVHMALPCVVVDEYMPHMPPGIGDYMVVSGWNGTTSFYKPVYESDKLYSVVDEQHFQDITPPAGSKYRTFLMSGWGRVFNQKGELVAEGANVLKESYRRHRDKNKRNRNGIRAWESPDWWHQHPAHMYTDRDWETILALWKSEKRPGAKPLYWDDVKVGDQPQPTADSPILAEVQTNIMGYVPQWVTDLKRDMLDPDYFKTLVKNSQGIYVPPQHLNKGVDTEPPGPGMAEMPPEHANRDGRSVVGNSFCAKLAAVMIYNWMGDYGWVERLGWDIMPKPPGYPDSVIPPLPRAGMPALFDKYPYLEKVPSLKDRRAESHPLEGDVIVNRGYVTDKYKKGEDYFADLVWWCETIDSIIVQEGFATVKLPKRA